jgi:cytochrome b subunit of formate dehydrogenase
VNPFHYAKNIYSNDYLPQQLTGDLALLLLSLVLVMGGLVLIRRAFGIPRRGSTGKLPPPGLTHVERYELMARFWHWSVFGMILALWISGAAFFAPGLIPPLPFGIFTWLFVHLAFGGLFIVGTTFHSVHGFFSHLDPRTVWFDRHDGTELVASTKYYLGLSNEVPKAGKFGVGNKVFHTTIVVLTVTVIVTGISLTLDTMGWASMNQEWQRWQRLIHDVAAYGFLVVIAAHIFWQLLKARRPQLRAIFTGKIPVETYSANHDWERWEPDAVYEGTKKRKRH